MPAERLSKTLPLRIATDRRAAGRPAARRPARRLAPHLVLVAALVAVVGLAAADDPLAARRARVEQMSQAEKDELARRLARFRRLPPEVQAQLRRLDRELAADPEREALLGVMQRYFTWAAETLSPAELAELEPLDPEQRLRRVEQLHARHRQRRRELILPADREVLAAFVEEWVLRDRPERLRRRLEQLEPGQRRRAVAMLVLHQLQNGERRPFERLNRQDLEGLQAALSEPLRRALETANPANSRRLVAQWAVQSLRHALAETAVIADEELARFFSEELDDAQRDSLMQLSGEEMQTQLRILYLQRTLPDDLPDWLPALARPPKPPRPFEASPEPPRPRRGPQQPSSVRRPGAS